VYEALKNLFTKIIPSFGTTIYNSTIEPIIGAFKKFSPTLAKFIDGIKATWVQVETGVSKAVR
jgi:hypothetical protein